MKQFNLEEAIAGKPIMSKSGKHYKFIDYVPDAQKDSRVIVMSSLGHILVHYEDGSYYSEPSSEDLVMATEKKTLYVNVYKEQHSDRNAMESCAFLTKEDALEDENSNLAKFLAVAIPIEIEV